ncbi:MAG: AraC family transcriptional regulator [Opitutales bacterium]
MVDNLHRQGRIYTDQVSQHEIDDCLPQRQALESGKISLHALSQGHYPGQQIPPQTLPNIPSLGFFDAIGQQDWGTEMHRNEGIEICFQETGHSTLIVEDTEYPLPAGTLSITRPWQAHQLGNPHVGPGRLHWIIIDVGITRPDQAWHWPEWCMLIEQDLKELTKALRGNETPTWTTSPEIGKVFNQLAGYILGDAPAANATRILIQVNLLLAELLDLMRHQNVQTDESLSSQRRTAQLFLQELKRDPGMLMTEWTLNDMAEQCGIGRTKFAHYCYEMTNTSPIDYLNRCRLAQAARRLREEPDTSITTIAMDVGFSSSQYFARKFKARYSMTAQQWRAPTYKGIRGIKGE